ncbi:MAG TPA: type VII secretion protein EccE [Micromonosporaceae bacterium]|nr:type VII secretion protein EccE [Micromonosporaceae bacterium]
MTVRAADLRPESSLDQGSGPHWPELVRPGIVGNRLFGVRPGQLVATQAALATLLAAAGRGPLVGAAATLAATALVLGSWIRIRRRWLFEWLAVGLRYAARRHTLTAPAEPAALLDLVAPATRVFPTHLDGEAAAVICDGYGLAALLELGDPTGLLNDAPQMIPAPLGLLPATGPHTPPARLQLLLTAAPAPTLRLGGNSAAISYRHLADGRIPGHEQAVLVVRVRRTEGWTDEDLLRALASILRRVRRRVAPVPGRVLGQAAALRVLAEVAHLDGAAPVRESWPAVRLGGLLQASFRLQGWPDLPTETMRRLVPELLALPAAAATVSLGATRAGAGPGTTDLTVRLAAEHTTALAAAERGLQRLLDAAGVRAQRLDGEQLAGLAATLPIGLAPPGPAPTAPGTGCDFDLPFGTAGLVIGANRHQDAVSIRLFRAELTRAVLIGGARGAQIIALRALALGARVVVQTTRPSIWDPFLRGATMPGEEIAVVPPGRTVSGPPATPLRPLLVIVDTGPVTPDGQPGSGWQARLVVRDGLSHGDLDLLARADLALLQPLRPEEATLAGKALGLGASAQWLTHIRHDMVALINRRALRWVLLSLTPVEAQLVGPPIRR